MLSKKKYRNKKTKTKKSFFLGGGEKITLGSMQPLIKSLLVKNRNLSYYLEYINYKLSEQVVEESDDKNKKMKASDVDSVLQTFSVATNIIEAKIEKQEDSNTTMKEDDEDDFGDFGDCEEGNEQVKFCKLKELAEDREEDKSKQCFEEIKSIIEKYISERTEKIRLKLADDENNNKYTTFLTTLMKKLLTSVLKNASLFSNNELVSTILVAENVSPLAASAAPITEAEVTKTTTSADAILLTEVEAELLHDFKTFNSILAEDMITLSSNISKTIDELLRKTANGLHMSMMTSLNELFANHVGTYIEVFVLNNALGYKQFVEKIFLNVDKSSNMFNAVLNCNSLIQNYASKLILNKDFIKMLINSLGTTFDIVNLISIISFTNLTLSGGLIDSVTDPSFIAKAAALGTNLTQAAVAADFTKVYNDDANLKKDAFFLITDQIMKLCDPIRFAKSKINSIFSSVTGILYTNNEMVKTLNEKKESGEQLMNVILSWNKTISETAFKGISYSHKGEKLWNKLEASTILREFNPNTEEININTNLTKIYEDYDNTIKEVNNVICKLRCVETFLPMNLSLMMTTIPNNDFLNFKEEEIALLMQYVIKTTESSEIKNLLQSITSLTNLVQNEISKESSMREFIKIKIHAVANIDQDCNEKGTIPTTTIKPDEFDWSWKGIQKTIQDVAQFAIEGTIEGMTPEHILELEESKFSDLSLFRQKAGTIVQNKAMFYENLCTIIYSDWRMTYLIENQPNIDNLQELLSTCVMNRLDAYKILKKMGLMDVKCFESVLRKLSTGVINSIRDEYNRLQEQTSNEENFLVCILELMCTQRVKLCGELFSKYYDTEGYVSYKKAESTKFNEMWSTYKTSVRETLQSTTITYGWKSIQFIVNVLSKAQEIKSSATEQFKKYFFASSSGGGRRKRNRKTRRRNKGRHTKKYKKYRKK